MSNVLQLKGASSVKQTHSAPIFTNRFFQGLWTQRNPFRDAGSSRIEEGFYGQRGDAMLSGSNVEISNHLTPVRRPGNSVYNSQTFTAVDYFYEFRLFNTNTEQIKVMVDQASALYDGTGPSTKNLVWTKSAGAGQTFMQYVANTLYFGNGVDQKKWLQSLLTWTSSTTLPVYGLATYLVDANGNIEQLTSTIIPISTIAVNGSNVLTVVTSSATNLLTGAGGSPVLTVGLQVTFPAGMAAAFLSGQTVTITAVNAANFQAAFTHAAYGPTAETSKVATVVQGGSPVTGTVLPTWNVTPFGTTNDNLAQWTNRGGTTENWGIVAGATPATFNVGVGNSGWQANAFYANDNVIIDSNSNLQQVTTGGISGATTPAWAILDGNTTTDGAVTWTQLKTAAELTWAAHTQYAAGSFLVANASGTNCLFKLAPYNNVKIIQQPGSPQPNTTTGDYVNLYYFATSGNVGIFSPYGAGAGSATAHVKVNNLLFNIGGDPNTALTNFTLNQSGEITGSTVPYGNETFGLVVLFSINIPTAGHYTITINHDDGMFFGIDGLATLVSGPNQTFHGLTSMNSYTTLGGIDQNGNNSDTYVVQFPTAGQFNCEIDYFNWIHERTLNVQIQGYTPIPIANGTTPASMTSAPNWPAWTLTGAPSYPSVTERSSYNGPFGVYSPTGGALQWRNIGPITDYSWHSKTKFFSATPDTIVDPNNNTEAPYEAGVTGASKTIPVFATGINQLTKDNPNLVWINQGPSTAPPSGTLSTFNGGWSYTVALVNTLTNTVSNGSPITAATGNFIGSAGVTVTGGLPTTIDPQVDYVAIFRTQDGGATYFLIPGTGNSIYTTTLAAYQAGGFVDTTLDSGLNFLIQPALNGQNTPPPTGLVNLTYHLNRIFGSVGNVAWWSSGALTPVGNGVEGFPPLNTATFPSLVTRIVPTSIGAIVFTVSDIYLVAGQGTSNSPLFPQPYAAGIGLLSYNALAVNGTLIYLFTADSQVIALDPSSGVSQIGFPIGDQFELSNWNPANAYVTWHVSGSQDQALYVSDGSTGWFRLTPTAAPEAGLTWSPFATITGGCKAVQSIEVSPAVHRLLIGPTGSGQLLKRDITVWTDNGTPYTANFTIGSIVLAHPGQLAEPSFITTESAALGTRPSVSVLLDEISGAPTNLGTYVADPTQLVSSTTVYSQRFYFKQATIPALCRHMQITIGWVAENFKNELLSLTIYGGFAVEP